MTELKYAKHITLNVDLTVGETIIVEGWGPSLNGKKMVIEAIEMARSESGVMVTLAGWGRLDSNWITKLPF